MMDYQTIKKNKIFSRMLMFLLIGSLAGLSSCYYDNEEALYPVRPGTSNCDTANPTYAATIQPIIQNNCQGCHSGGAPSGNLDLTSYNNVVSAVNSKNLFDHLLGSSYSLMPPSGSLTECNINEFNSWINKGMPSK